MCRPRQERGRGIGVPGSTWQTESAYTIKMLACCLELLNTEPSSPARPMANRRPEEGGVHAEEKRHLRQRGLELQWRTQAAWDSCMRSDRTEVATPSCHLLALCLWENLLTSLSFNLFTYNVKICQK